jgi:hypothetical protein
LKSTQLIYGNAPTHNLEPPRNGAGVIIEEKQREHIMYTNYTKAERIEAAESALYNWACGNFTTKNVKHHCEALGFTIDFRQPDAGDWMEAFYSDGSAITLRV